MPKTHRDLLKRKLAQAYINMNWAATYLLELHNEFNPVHPELGAALMNVLEGLDIQTEVLRQFANDAWGHENPDWVGWAATGKPRYKIDGSEDSVNLEQLPESEEPHINENTT